MSQSPDNRTSLSGYIMDTESTAEMARLTKLAQHLTEGIGLFPEGLDLTSRSEILDIGCGPGEWVMEMAQRFPTHQIRGIDISSLMTTYAQFCAQTEGITNVQFTQADARQPLPFPDGTFDMVHARMTSAWLSTTTWLPTLREYCRVLKPGGLVCSTEYENLGITNSAALTHYNTLSMQALRLSNQCFSPGGDHSGVTVMLPSFLREAGFARIQYEARAVLYSFGAPAHLTMVENLTIGLKLIQPFLLRQGVAKQGELDTLYEGVVKDMRTEDFRAMVYYLRIWGEKNEIFLL